MPGRNDTPTTTLTERYVPGLLLAPRRHDTPTATGHGRASAVGAVAVTRALSFDPPRAP